MITPNWPAPSNIKAMTICRNDNIDKIDNLFSLNELQLLNQTHGSTCVQLPSPLNKKNDADASFTTTKNIFCVVKTADCLPILVCDKAGTWVAAIHAGWRGLAAGVIQNTLYYYKKNNTTSNTDLLVWLGPAISQKHYVVGDDFRDVFVTQRLQHQQAFVEAPHENGLNKWYADLYYLARIILDSCGIDNKNIYGGNYCTYSNPDIFYSARRERDSRRLLSGIYISKNNQFDL